MKKTQIIAVYACMISTVVIADTLKVTVTGLKTDKGGNLRLGVFNESRRDQFPEGKYLFGVDLPAGQSEMTIEIPAVKPGKYAIATFQDFNQNQKLDRDADGIPKEIYGFSVLSANRESTYEEALFDTEKDGYDVSIKLRMPSLEAH